MSSELDRVFEKLAKVLESLSLAGAGSTNPKPHSSRSEGIALNISLKLSSIDEFLASAQGRRGEAGSEPLIDIIEDDNMIKVLVLLPGISKDDVSVHISGRTVRVEVAKGENVYVKEMVCTSPPDNVSVVPAVENNSVVELLFRKKGGRPHS